MSILFLIKIWIAIFLYKLPLLISFAFSHFEIKLILIFHISFHLQIIYHIFLFMIIYCPLFIIFLLLKHPKMLTWLWLSPLSIFSFGKTVFKCWWHYYNIYDLVYRKNITIEYNQINNHDINIIFSFNK